VITEIRWRSNILRFEFITESNITFILIQSAPSLLPTLNRINTESRKPATFLKTSGNTRFYHRHVLPVTLHYILSINYLNTKEFLTLEKEVPTLRCSSEESGCGRRFILLLATYSNAVYEI
jgi:hypothetical protein